MSVKQIAKVWEHEFPHNQQSVMLALADHADHDGKNIYPSIARTAWKTGYSARHVQRIIKELCKSGVLVLVRDATPRRPNEYKFDWSKAKEKAEFRGDNLSGGDTHVTPGVTPMSQEPSFNRQDIKESEFNIAREYEQVTGRLLGKTLSEVLDGYKKDWDAHLTDLPDDHKNRQIGGAQAVIEAMKESMLNINKVHHSYVGAIIDGWIKNGYKVDTRQKKNGKTSKKIETKTTTRGSVYG